jgi:hypothetical protein
MSALWPVVGDVPEFICAHAPDRPVETDSRWEADRPMGTYADKVFRLLTNPKDPRFAAGRSARAWLPLGLIDSELDTILSLAEPVPMEHRDNFLRAIADALAKYRAAKS